MDRMMLLRAFVCSLLLIGGAPLVATAQTTARVLYFTGDVTAGSTKVKLGQTLKSSDVLSIPKSATLQLSINGKVMKYTGKTSVKVSDAIKSAGTGENGVVANSVRTVAGASGMGRAARTSVAGATRADKDKNKKVSYTDSMQTEMLNTGSARLNSKVESITGLSNVGEWLDKAVDEMKGDAIVILQPRSTAVVGDAVTFRWLRSPSVAKYRVTIENWVGDPIYTFETSDTFFVWNEGTALAPGTIYSWSVEDVNNGLNSYGASFHRLSSEEEAAVSNGLASIRAELGSDNPAYALIAGAFLSENGCYGQAAEQYRIGALTADDHRDLLWEMACEEYLYEMFVPVEEGMIICNGR